MTDDASTIVLKQGATWNEEFQWVDDSPEETPFNLSGFGVRGQIRKYKDRTAELLATITFAVTEPENGKFEGTIGATVTENINSNGYYDIEVYSLSDPNEVYRIGQGTVVVDKEVTV